MAPRNTIRLSDTDRGLRAAVALLRQGGLVAFATETVYGLGADARDSRAVARIFEAKGRPRFNPLIVHVPDLAAAQTYGDITGDTLRLAQAFWPGPMTLVVPRLASAGIAELVTAGLDTIALRVPAHPSAQALLRAFEGPLAAPSANRSGKISATTADHVMDGLSGRIAGVVDAGPTGVGVESTIVGMAPDGATLLRPGGLPAEAIEAALGTTLRSRTGDAITAPGQLASHYAPEVKLVLNATSDDAGTDPLWLGFGPLNGREGLSLSEIADPTEAAANLFAQLHEIDAMARARGITRVLVDTIPNRGLGLAINDRLARAAAPR